MADELEENCVLPRSVQENFTVNCNALKNIYDHLNSVLTIPVLTLSVFQWLVHGHVNESEKEPLHIVHNSSKGRQPYWSWLTN